MQIAVMGAMRDSASCPGPRFRFAHMPSAVPRKTEHALLGSSDVARARRAEDPGCQVAPEDPGIKICPDKALPDSDNGGDITPPQREVSHYFQNRL